MLDAAARAGRTVTRLQTVEGTDFMYHPPPRQKMPSAATIAGAPINRCARLVPGRLRVRVWTLADGGHGTPRLAHLFNFTWVADAA